MSVEPVYIDSPDGFTFEIGLCSEHMEPAKRYLDGSWSCHWEPVVETSVHGPGDQYRFVPIREITNG